MKVLLESVSSADAEVQALASTAIAYLSDKSEHRPGSPNSTINSSESPAKFTQRKMRFHDSSRPTTVDEQEARPSSPHTQPDVDNFDDAPGARTKAEFGTFAHTKVSATHDSKSKGPKFVQEQPEVFHRRQTKCVIPEAVEVPYEEVPSPLPSPRPTLT